MAVHLGGLAGVMGRVEMVPVGGVRVMRGLFGRSGVVMFRRLHVMACRVFVMLRSFPMMFYRILRHRASFVSALPVVVILIRHERHPSWVSQARHDRRQIARLGVEPPHQSQ